MVSQADRAAAVGSPRGAIPEAISDMDSSAGSDPAREHVLPSDAVVVGDGGSGGDQTADGEPGYLAALAALPGHVALQLRDHLRGLAAEAGSARALAGKLRREWRIDAARLGQVNAELRAALEGAQAERDAARAERDAAAAERDTAAGRFTESAAALASVRTELAELRYDIMDLTRQLDDVRSSSARRPPLLRRPR